MDSQKFADINALQADRDLISLRHKEDIAHVDNVATTVLSATSSLIQYLEGHTTKTEVVNQLESIATPDVKYVVEALQVLDATLQTHENTDLSGVTALMQELLSEARLIPKELATIPEAPQAIDYTKQLASLKDAIQAVEKVVKAQKLIAEAPVVNVPAPNVKVDAPDLVPLQQGFRDVVKAITKIVIPEYKTDNAAVEKLLKDTNKTLTKLLEKPVGGGGGGGSSWPAIGSNGFPQPLNLDASGSLKTTATINTGDIEIGAVEIKDGTTDDRTSVINTAPTTQYGLVTRNIPSGTQAVSAATLPLPSGAATDATLTNGSQLVGIDNTKSVKYYAQVLTASTTLAPTAGKAIKLVKMQVLQNPDNSSANQVTLGFVSTGNFFTGWVGSDSSEVIGATNEVLSITLANSQAVSVLLRFKEL